jgi:hypothetical protein
MSLALNADIETVGYLVRVRFRKFLRKSNFFYRILVRNPKGKRPLGRPRRRWVYNIKMDLTEVGWDGRNWIDLAQDRDRWRAYVNAVMNLRVP